MEISTIEHFTTRELVKLLVNTPVYCISDNHEELNLKYIHLIEDCLTDIDQTLINEFPEFDYWWLKSSKEITNHLENNNLHVKTSKFISVLLAIYLVNNRILPFLGSHMTPDVFRLQRGHFVRPTGPLRSANGPLRSANGATSFGQRATSFGQRATSFGLFN